MIIAGKEYTAKEIDFNMVCDLASHGVNIYSVDPLPMNVAIRAYFAVCAGVPLETAGKLLERHLMDGGDLTEISEAFSDKLENSGFFKHQIARLRAAVEARTQTETAE